MKTAIVIIVLVYFVCFFPSLLMTFMCKRYRPNEYHGFITFMQYWAFYPIYVIDRLIRG